MKLYQFCIILLLTCITACLLSLATTESHIAASEKIMAEPPSMLFNPLTEYAIRPIATPQDSSVSYRLIDYSGDSARIVAEIPARKVVALDTIIKQDNTEY